MDDKFLIFLNLVGRNFLVLCEKNYELKLSCMFVVDGWKLLEKHGTLILAIGHDNVDAYELKLWVFHELKNLEIS